jgi:hypothetical protein
MAQLGREHAPRHPTEGRLELADEVAEVQAGEVGKALGQSFDALGEAAEPFRLEPLELLVHGLGHRCRDALGHRLHQPVPRRHRCLDPLGAAPRQALAVRSRQRGHGVDPQVRDVDRLVDVALLRRSHGRVGLGRDRLAGHVGGHLHSRLWRLGAEHLLHLVLQHGHDARVGRIDAHLAPHLLERLACAGQASVASQLAHQRVEVGQLAALTTGSAELADQLAEVRDALPASAEKLLQHRPELAEVTVILVILVIVSPGVASGGLTRAAGGTAGEPHPRLVLRPILRTVPWSVLRLVDGSGPRVGARGLGVVLGAVGFGGLVAIGSLGHDGSSVL